MNAEVPQKFGKERRGFHISRNIDITVIAVVVIALVGAAGSGVWWYSEVNSRLAEAEQRDNQLARTDEQLAEMIADSETRTRRMIERQEKRTQQRFEQLSKQLNSVTGYLRDIATNTGGPGRE